MKVSVLSGLMPGRQARVVQAACGDSLKGRLEDLGLCPGTVVRCLHKSPAGSPAAYDIQGAVIALRSRDAARICVEAIP